MYYKPTNAWSKPISIIASKTAPTSVSPITVTQDQQSTITQMAKQIQDLFQTLQKRVDNIPSSSTIQHTVTTIMTAPLVVFECELCQSWTSVLTDYSW